ncbi:MAG: hypothetical protein KDD62_11985, partial [Bdellovibrionales bacterium]|nr:hypothetical protein [Bdellovibrionales bacterium]
MIEVENIVSRQTELLSALELPDVVKRLRDIQQALQGPLDSHIESLEAADPEVDLPESLNELYTALAYLPNALNALESFNNAF